VLSFGVCACSHSGFEYIIGLNIDALVHTNLIIEAHYATEFA
jgi:hypothetical protein